MKNIIFTCLLFSLAFTLRAATTNKTVVMRIIAPGGSYAETTVYFALGVAPAFVDNQDAAEVLSTAAGQPSIYSLSADNVLCGINGYSALATTAVIPVGVKIDTAGNFVFNASLLSKFDPTTIIQLEDRQLNVFTDLRTSFYPVYLSDSGIANGRFFLHVSSAVQTSSITANCANNSGQVNLIQDSSILWSTVYLYDTTGLLIDSLNNVSGLLNFGNLPQGVYQVALYFEQNYVSTLSVQVKGNYIVAGIQNMALTATVNQEITFHALATNTTDYTWNFGDSSQIIGVVNPTYYYAWPGVFTVMLICTNEAGCQGLDSVTITVSDATGIKNVESASRKAWAYAKNITLVLNEDLTPGAEVTIYNLLGQPVYVAALAQTTTNIAMNQQADGYYLVSVINNNITTVNKVEILN